MKPNEFLYKAVAAARAAGHVWPEYAACEAAEESAWGESKLAREANNLFGQKAGHCSTQYPTIEMPTHEWVGGKLEPAIALWPKFPDWTTAFRERMNLLRVLAPHFQNYALALQATNGRDFVTFVSRTWSTDPQRAANVLDIYAHHAEVLSGLSQIEV